MAGLQVYSVRLISGGKPIHLPMAVYDVSPVLTLEDSEPALLFEVLARRLKQLRMKAGHSESDKARWRV